MARCRCQSELCVCAVSAGAGISISGSGSPNDPWVISSVASVRGLINVKDTPTLDLTLTGQGTASSPFLLSGNVIAGVPGSPITGHGLSGLGIVSNPLRIDLCTYGDLAAAAACAP